MATRLFQPRGPVYLRELDEDLNPGPAFSICPDSISFSMNVETWTHINKCGTADVEDARGINSMSAEITMSFPTKTDKDMALGTLGLITAAAGSPSVVVDEQLPDGIVAGGFIFLGGKTRHRAITGLVISKDASPGGADLTVNVDYTLDATTGMVTFLTTPTGQPLSAGYSHTDPASVSMLTAAQKEYAFDVEFRNRPNNNQKGSLELYRVRFDPAEGVDMMPDNNQALSIKGSVLADTTREDDDTEFGQFGRIVNLE